MERLPASSQVEDFLARLRDNISQSEAVGKTSEREAAERSQQETDVGLRRRPLIYANDEVPGMDASTGNVPPGSLRDSLFPSQYAEQAARGQHPQAGPAQKEAGGFDRNLAHLSSEGCAQGSSQRALRSSADIFHGASQSIHELAGEPVQENKPLAVPETPHFQRGYTPQAFDTMQSAFRKFEHAEMQGGSQPTEILDSQEEAMAGKVSTFMSPQVMHQSRQVAMQRRDKGFHTPNLLRPAQPVILSSFPQQFTPPSAADSFTRQKAPFYDYYAGGNQASYPSNPSTLSRILPPSQVQTSPEIPGVFSRSKELEALESEAAQSLKQRMILKWQLDIRSSILKTQLEETEQEMQKNEMELGFASRQAQEIRDLRRQIDLNSMSAYQPAFSHSAGGPFDPVASERLFPGRHADQIIKSQVLPGGLVQGDALPASSAPLPPEEMATRTAFSGKNVTVGAMDENQPVPAQPFLTQPKVTKEDSQGAQEKDAAGDHGGEEELVKRATSQAEVPGSRTDGIPDVSVSEGAGKAGKEHKEDESKQEAPLFGATRLDGREVTKNDATGQKAAVAEQETKPQLAEGSSGVQKEDEKEARSEEQRKEKKPVVTSDPQEGRTESVHWRRHVSDDKAERGVTVEARAPESERRPQIMTRNADEEARREKNVQRGRETGGGRHDDAEKERGRPERLHHAGRVGNTTVSDDKCSTR